MELIKRCGLPHWLIPPKLDRGHPYTEDTLEEIFRNLQGGQNLMEACEDAHLPDYKEVLVYIMRDPELKQRYYDSKDIRAEILLEKIDIEARGGPGEIPEEVQRSNLIVKSLMYRIEKEAPKRYGPKTNVEVTHTYDVSKAMERATKRLEQMQKGQLIEGEVVR